LPITPTTDSYSPAGLDDETTTLAEYRRAPAGTVSADLAELASIGSGPDNGITRVAWSTALFEAYEWVAERMRELGLEVDVDPAGNLLGRWESGEGAPIVVGSHLDTVPSGGALDGALGVVAAVHAVRLLKSRGVRPNRPLWVVAFMDEEGTRFDTALFGSRAFTGEDMSRTGDQVDSDGIGLAEAMRHAGFDLDRVELAQQVDQIGAYIELHIEQGPVLATDRIQIGAVTSIVGLRRYHVTLHGHANHAGTTPMRLRRDALAGASRIVLALRDFARSREGVTANVGKLHVAPGGANVVPGRADFTVDIRSDSSEALAKAERTVESTVHAVAGEEQLEASLQATFALDPIHLDPELVADIERAAAAEGATCRRMPSGAGHDAMLLARHVPTGMIFVPSRGGVSHSPDEYTHPDELELGMRVLAACLQRSLEKES
jgi:allantoate deiminase